MSQADVADGLGPIVVAIPARDEEDRIAACLEALDGQTGARADHIVLLLNNCADGSAGIARALRPGLKSELHVLDFELPPHQANAGYARHLAFEAAERLAGETGILLTTDADGRVDPDWVEGNLMAIRNGADAVAGWVELDPIDWGAIPLELHEDDARECAYDVACDELHALLDPDPADPWPRHTQASGASLAVTIRAYREAGGIPAVASGEDRAFIGALRRVDARIRHSLDCRVVVSGRIEGRAAGGMADTIRRRLVAPDPCLDIRLERAEMCGRRAALRRLARLIHDGGSAPPAWWKIAGMTEQAANAALAAPHFGIAWDEIEARSAHLIRRPVPARALPLEQAIAERLLDRARRDPVDCGRALIHSAWRASSLI